MKLIEMKLPAHWATALIYGDLTGLVETDEGVREVARMDLLTDGLRCIDVADDAEFTWGSYDCPDELAGDYCTYIFQVME